jgi:hypothetical protein
MAPSNETRQLGAAGLGNLSFPGGNDNRVYPTKSAFKQEAISRLRRQRLVEHLRRLGPAPLGHFIREVEAATGADVTARLVRYVLQLSSGMFICGVMLHNKNDRWWIGLPGKPYTKPDVSQLWTKVLDFRDKPTHDRFQQTITPLAVAAFERAKAEVAA